jgi:hypothetical protein
MAPAPATAGTGRRRPSRCGSGRPLTTERSGSDRLRSVLETAFGSRSSDRFPTAPRRSNSPCPDSVTSGTSGSALTRDLRSGTGAAQSVKELMVRKYLQRFLRGRPRHHSGDANGADRALRARSSWRHRPPASQSARVRPRRQPRAGVSARRRPGHPRFPHRNAQAVSQVAFSHRPLGRPSDNRAGRCRSAVVAASRLTAKWRSRARTSGRCASRIWRAATTTLGNERGGHLDARLFCGVLSTVPICRYLRMHRPRRSTASTAILASLFDRHRQSP